jgi:hypothetical protein
MKQTWKNINMLLKQSNNKSDLPDLLKNESSTYSGPHEIASGFNNFFTKIGPTLATNISKPKFAATHYLPMVNYPDSFVMFPCDHNEVVSIIKALKPKLSSGYDSISPKLLQQTFEGLISPIVHTVNLSLTTGIVPDKMKIAKVVPIFKNGDKKLISNYRPVSLLPVLSKIIERAVYNRLYKYITSKSILSSSQYGFRNSLSTNLAIIELQDRIIDHLANREHCAGIFLDLSKAFDTLDHSLLICKLSHYGVRGTALSWFENYLTNRIQYTSIEDSKSEYESITCGVPQGSILGPLLFLVYINDITGVTEICDKIIFADDTNLLFHCKTYSNLSDVVNNEMEKFLDWFRANKLSLNIGKTKFMHFKPTNRPSNESPLAIKIGNEVIEEVSCIKFLGVFLSCNLSWTEHIKSKSSQIAHVISVLCRLKHVLPERNLLQIYNGLIAPHLSYGIESWGSAPGSVLKRMIILQKKAMRIITNSTYNAHTSPIFKRLKILKIPDIFKLHCAKINYRKILNFLPEFHSSKLQTGLNQRQTRQTNDVYIHQIRHHMQKHSLNFKVGHSWNSLPGNLKSISNISLNSFSRNVKKHYLSLYEVTCSVHNCYSCNVASITQ